MPYDDDPEAFDALVSSMRALRDDGTRKSEVLAAFVLGCEDDCTGDITCREDCIVCVTMMVDAVYP